MCGMVWLLAAIGCSMSKPPLQSQSPSKIGYVETSKLMAGFSVAQNAREEFVTKQKEWDHHYKLLQESLAEANELMKAQYDSVSKAGKAALRDTIRKRNLAVQQYSEQVKSLAVEEEKQLMTPVIVDVQDFMTMWGKQHGYSLILGTIPGNILHADSSLNLTAQVLADLNARYSSGTPNKQNP